MRYLLFNNRTKQSLYFNDRQALHKWIVSHFRTMSYRTMSSWTLCRYSEYELHSENGVQFSAVLKSRIAELPDYIMSFLKF